MSGGAERLIADVVSDTSREKFSHTVCVLGKADFFAPKILESGSEVIELNLSGKHPWLAAARKVIPIIRQQQPDLILSWLYDASIVSRLAALRNRKIPLVTTLHAPDYDSETIKAGNWSPRKMEMMRWIDKISAKITKPYFVSCSNFVAESYKKNLGVDASEIRVIHNFINLESLKCEPGEAQKLRESLDIPKDGFVYTNVGRLDPQKGQIYLIKAFPKVLEAVPNAYLVIVGDGGLKSSFEELAKNLKIDHRVLLLGNRKDIGACLEMSDVFVFPALFEGFGIALVEAMAKSLPCIATRLEVLEEIIDDKVSGLFVAPESESELADAMIQIYQQPDFREKLGQQGFEKVKKRFFSQVIIPEWEKLYTEMSSDF